MAASNRVLRAAAAAVALAWGLVAFAGAAAGQTLEAVRERGYLICGANGSLPGFAQQVAPGQWTGFDVDLCRAVAAAVFGDPSRMEFVPLAGESRFAQLQTGVVDLMTRNAPWTQRRDTGYGASYVGTAFFDGQAFMVPATAGLVSAYELTNVSICVRDNSDDLQRLQEFFFSNQVNYSPVLYENLEDLAVAYRSNLCEAISAPGRWLHAIRRNLPDPAGHRILPERISKDLLGPVVREGDDQWFEIVRWTLFTLIDAEELGISSVNLDSMSAARTPAIRRMLGLETDFGAPLGLSRDFMADIIRAVGNYSEVFDRNFGPATGPALLRGQNSLWSNGGLLYAAPVR